MERRRGRDRKESMKLMKLLKKTTEKNMRKRKEILMRRRRRRRLIKESDIRALACSREIREN